MEMRIGLGKDVHRLVEGRRFLLGGVCLSAEKGELGHSDGDVLAHAVIDALLGACGLGDIGGFFPDSDPRYKDCNSMRLVDEAFSHVKAAGWKLVNLDCVITCESPKLSPYREEIRAALAESLSVEKERIFVKGKTNEGLGEIGAGDAVEALAVCLLESVL